ncbi:MAG TPA: adenylate/guanylate cyclase domain-containing protein, partial [Gammaproteobacteria bacterium]
MLKQRLLRYALGFALTIVFILHAGGHFPIPFIKALENQAYDFRLRLGLPEKVDKKVVIIDIDEKSLEAIGQWPWDRNVIAKIVDNLFDYYKVNVVGFDIVFAEKDEDPSDQIIEDIARSSLASSAEFQNIYARAQTTLHRDQQLARSLKDRNTVLGIVFDQLDTSLKKGKLPETISEFTPEIIAGFPSLTRAAGYTANIDILQKHALTGGYFDNPLLDDDGVFRRVPLLQVYNDRIYQSLALAVTRASMGNTDLRIGISTLDEASNQKSLEFIYIGDIAIPVDESSAVLVPYIGKQGSFDYISATDVLNKTLPADAITNKIALFGASAAGLLDLRTTPLQAAYPGVEVHANIIQGILDQTVKHKPEYIMGFEIILLFVFGLVLTFILPTLSPLWSSLSLTAALVLIFYINTMAWNNMQIVLPMASPLLLIVSLYILNMTYGFFVESRGKRQLTHLFGQYVPPELVDEMSKNLTKINLDGEIRQMTVLFTDVRNFTTISENMEPKELTKFINSFLTPLTQVIHQNRGTIDKYMGDAIMAFWGAPLEDSQHARHALTAGIEMLKATQTMREEFSKLG